MLFQVSYIYFVGLSKYATLSPLITLNILIMERVLGDRFLISHYLEDVLSVLQRTGNCLKLRNMIFERDKGCWISAEMLS
jgi:hypothetical protein